MCKYRFICMFFQIFTVTESILGIEQRISLKTHYSRWHLNFIQYLRNNIREKKKKKKRKDVTIIT